MESTNKDAEMVTSENPKNTGRVEWGRKLGKMSKERKKLKQEIEEKAGVSTDNNKRYLGLLVFSGAVVGIVVLYFRKNIPVEEVKPDLEKPKAKTFSEF